MAADGGGSFWATFGGGAAQEAKRDSARVLLGPWGLGYF